MASRHAHNKWTDVPLTKISARPTNIYLHGLACWNNQIWSYLPSHQNSGGCIPEQLAQIQRLHVVCYIPRGRNNYRLPWLLDKHFDVFLQETLHTRQFAWSWARRKIVASSVLHRQNVATEQSHLKSCFWGLGDPWKQHGRTCSGKGKTTLSRCTQLHLPPT